MLVKLNKQQMELEIQVGVLENYKPTKEIKKLEKRVKALRELMDKFMVENVKPELTEIEELVKKHNEQYIVKE